MDYGRPFRRRGIIPEDPSKPFSVWNGQSISRRYNTIEDIAEAVRYLAPANMPWRLEWLVKAGEGGSYQAQYLHPKWGDPHPLAIDSADKLAILVEYGRSEGLRVVPYFIVRGKAEWNPSEWQQIADCASITGKVVLNLEPGAEYWNGPTSPNNLRGGYLEPLQRMLPPNAELELACIPRVWVFQTLGGAAAINTWLTFCKWASWECYDAVANDLRVDDSMAVLDQLEVPNEPNYRIPIVQRSRIEYWAESEFCANGMEVWHLDGD